MDTTILECGIIRNLLQPLVENYFVHGFSPDAIRNQLIISGEPDGPSHISISVEDNGRGMTPERLQEMQNKLALRNNSVNVTDSYGLQNLNDRIRLFYGNDCCVTIDSKPNCYTIIRMRIRRMTLEEHELWT